MKKKLIRRKSKAKKIKNLHGDNASLKFLYHTKSGRVILKAASNRNVSKVCGRFLDSRLSKPLIKGFVKKNSIDLDEFYSENFRCFNDCFCRKIKEEYRPIDTSPENLISPCDGLMSAYNISDGTVFPIKQSEYTLSSLLGGNEEVADIYKNGICLVFRLCPDHYHRYCYIDDGIKGDNVFIPGVLHTVRPIALEKVPVFTQNSREYTVMDTHNFGKVTQIDVGALLIGKIDNYHNATEIKRGEEKGKFLYGGSTIVLLFEKDKISVPEYAFEATAQSKEIPVVLGKVIGHKK